MSTNIMITIFNFGKSYKYINIENAKGEIGVCVCVGERERERESFKVTKTFDENTDP